MKSDSTKSRTDYRILISVLTVLTIVAFLGSLSVGPGWNQYAERF